MPPPPAGPPRESQIQPQRGREPFSGAEETILKQFLDEFRKKNKEQRKDLLGYKIYRLIKAAGLQLTAEEWRQRKKVMAVLYCGNVNWLTCYFRKSRTGIIIMAADSTSIDTDITRQFLGSTSWLM